MPEMSEQDERKPSFAWGLLCFVLPIAVILYGTVVIALRPPVLPLIATVALAGGMCLVQGYKWNELQEGMFAALGRVQIAVVILVMVGMIISSWIACGTITCPLVPWSVHAFIIMGILEVSAWDYAPYAFLNWIVPIFAVIFAFLRVGVWHRDGTPYRFGRKIAPEPAYVEEQERVRAKA